MLFKYTRYILFLNISMFILQTMRAGDVVCTRVYDRD